MVVFYDFVCQEYAQSTNKVIILPNNHGTIFPVQYNPNMGRKKAIYSVNISTETDEYYFVTLNDVRCTLRCSRLQHRNIPHCNHTAVIRQQLKEKGGIDLSKIRKTNIAMRHRAIWDPEEGIVEDAKVEIDMPGTWIPPPKYMRTDDDDVGYESVDSEEFVDRFFDNMQSEDAEVREREHRINRRKETRAEYYNYKYAAPDATDVTKKYLFSLRFICLNYSVTTNALHTARKSATIIFVRGDLKRKIVDQQQEN